MNAPYLKRNQAIRRIAILTALTTIFVSSAISTFTAPRVVAMDVYAARGLLLCGMMASGLAITLYILLARLTSYALKLFKLDETFRWRVLAIWVGGFLGVVLAIPSQQAGMIGFGSLLDYCCWFGPGLLPFLFGGPLWKLSPLFQIESEHLYSDAGDE